MVLSFYGNNFQSLKKTSQNSLYSVLAGFIFTPIIQAMPEQLFLDW